MASLKRPRPVAEEDEDDLIVLQNQFLQSKSSSSAQLVSQSKASSSSSSSSSSKKQDRKQADAAASVSVHPVVPPMSLSINIVERDVSNVTSVPAPVIGGKAFPEAVSRHDLTPRSEPETADNRHQSIFARQHGLRAVSLIPHPVARRCLIDGSGLNLSPAEALEEVTKIQQENMRLIQEMSGPMREKAQADVLSSIQPDMLSFLKHRSLEKSKVSKVLVDEEMEPVPDVRQQQPVQLPQVTAEIIERERGKNVDQKCVHMDVVEEGKLKWMTPLPTATTASSIINSEARFGFEGQLIMHADVDMDCGTSTSRQGLHHHGSDQERAGYSLSELFTFIDSSLSAQKVIGLQVIGNLMKRSYRGEYDHVFDSSLAEQLIQGSEILLMIRRCLDDTSQTVTTAGINCLRNLICNTDMDELYLDQLFAWNVGSFDVPFLDPKTLDHVEKVDELKDDEIIRLDPIRGLIRTDLLPRLRYLLDHLIKQQDDPVIVKNVFAILIRVSRHSAESCRAIADTPFLLETIIAHFLQPMISLKSDSFYGNPYSQALKLIRILCASSSQVAAIIIDTFPHLLNSCRAFITIDPRVCHHNAQQWSGGREQDQRVKSTPADLMRLSLESLRMHCVCLQQDSSSSRASALTSLQQLFPILIRQSQYLLTMSPLEETSRNRNNNSSSSRSGCKAEVAAARGPDAEKELSGSNLFDWHFASTLIACLDRVAVIASAATSQSTDACMQEIGIKVSLAFKGIIESAVLKWITLMLNQVILPPAPASLDICLTIGIGVRFLLHSDQHADKSMLNISGEQATRSRDRLYECFLKPLVQSHTANATVSLWSKVIRNLTAGSSILLPSTLIRLKRGAGNQFDCQNSKQNINEKRNRSCGIHPDFGSCRDQVLLPAAPSSSSMTTDADDPRSGSSRIPSNDHDDDSCLPLFHAVIQISLALIATQDQHEEEKETALFTSNHRWITNHHPDLTNDGVVVECLQTLILTQGLVDFVSRINQSLLLMTRNAECCSFFDSFHLMVLSELALLSGRLMVQFSPEQESSLTTPPPSPVPSSGMPAGDDEAGVTSAGERESLTRETGSQEDNRRAGKFKQMTGMALEEEERGGGRLLLRQEKVVRDFLQHSLSLLTLIPDPIVKQDIKAGIIFSPALYRILLMQQAVGSAGSLLEDKMRTHLRIREEKQLPLSGSSSSCVSTGGTQSHDLMRQPKRQQEDEDFAASADATTGTAATSAGKVDHGISLENLNAKLVQVSSVYQQYSSCGSCYWIFDPIIQLMTKVRMSGALQADASTDPNSLTSVPEIKTTKHQEDEERTDQQWGMDVTSDSVNPIDCCLSFVRLLHQLVPQFLFPDLVSRRDTFMLITCSFLTGDLLDTAARSHMHHFLDYYLSLGSKFEISSDDEIPDQIFARRKNLPPKDRESRRTVSDLFDALVTEYESCSYSDPLFTSFILMFLRSSASSSPSSHQRSDQQTRSESRNSALKLKFFSEANSSCLQSMTTTRVSFDQRLVMQLISQPESDVMLIEAYVKCLLSGSISKDRNQLLFMMCALHVSQSLYLRPLDHHQQDQQKRLITSDPSRINSTASLPELSKEESLLMQKLRRSIDMCRNESLKRDLLNYQVVW